MKTILNEKNRRKRKKNGKNRKQHRSGDPFCEIPIISDRIHLKTGQVPCRAVLGETLTPPLDGSRGVQHAAFCLQMEAQKILVSVKFLSAILGPEMAAPTLWTPRISAFFLQENLHVHKMPPFRGGILGWGEVPILLWAQGIFWEASCLQLSFFTYNCVLKLFCLRLKLFYLQLELFLTFFRAPEKKEIFLFFLWGNPVQNCPQNPAPADHLFSTRKSKSEFWGRKLPGEGYCVRCRLLWAVEME